VTNVGSTLYFRTSKGAPNYQVSGIDVSKPISDNAWTTLVPEHPKDVLDWISCVNE